MFYVAERLGKTVDELLTGSPGPLGAREFVEWTVYFGRKAQRIELAQKKAKRGG
jgi:hypothetical protein